MNEPTKSAETLDTLRDSTVLHRLNDWAAALEYGDGNPYGADTLREAVSEIERLQKREAYLVAELNCLGGMDLNGDKDGRD